MNYYIQVIDENGVPKRLVGPGTWEQAVEKGVALINTELQFTSERDLTDDEKEAWEMDGTLEFSDVGAGAGGVYIVCSEEFS